MTTKKIDRKHKRLKISSAQALIEFALLLPIMLLLVLGAMDFGRMFFLKMSLINAAREGANYLAFFPEDAEDGFINTFNVITEEGNNAHLTITESDVTYTDCCTHGMPVEVTITKSIDLIYDSILQSLGVIGGPIQLTGTVKMVIQ
jgi:uncharacterized protein (UPF0333 family)